MEISNLTNHFLIAMPNVGGDFEGSVSFVCEHNADGAIAIIINKPLEIKLGEIFTQIGIENYDESAAQQQVMYGGPVHQERGFVLHLTAQSWQSTLNTNCGIAVTTSQDILRDIAKQEGPAPTLVSLGYAGWGPGQLEQELLNNYWLTTDVQNDIIFQLPFEQRWQAATRSLGIDPMTLSSQAGHA